MLMSSYHQPKIILILLLLCETSFCIRKSGEIAKLLLDSGADPNIKGADGLTVVHKAIAVGDLRTLKVLANHPKTDFYVQVEYCCYCIV